MLSSYLLIKRIPSAIMGQFALLGPPKKDFGMDNFFTEPILRITFFKEYRYF